MTLKLLVYIIIGLAILFQFIIKPIIHIIISLNELKNINKNKQNLGINLLTFSSISHKKLKLFYLLFIIVVTPFSIIFKTYLLLIGSLLFFQMYLILVKMENYSKFNGIYENGIIYNGICYWNDIHSWKLVNKNVFSFLKKDGLRFDLPEINDNKILQNILIEKQLKEEN